LWCETLHHPNEFQYNGKKKIRKILSLVTKKYFAGKYEASLNIFDELPQLLPPTSDFTQAQSNQLKKLLRIFYLGQLVGLPTLNTILQRFEIKSNKEQVNYNKLCKKLSNSLIHQIFEYVFEVTLSEALKQGCSKHDSTWSRELLTIVLDDSVFKQWLDQQGATEKFECCYSRFFSGQCGQMVYGFQVVTLGVSIGGVLYPLYFKCVKKKADSLLSTAEKATKQKKKSNKKPVKGRKVAKKRRISRKKQQKIAKQPVQSVKVAVKVAKAADSTAQISGKLLTKSEKQAAKIANEIAKTTLKAQKQANKVANAAAKLELQLQKQADKATKAAAKIAAKAQTDKGTIQVANELVDKLGIFLNKLANQGCVLPTLHFSCDSGYSHVSLANTCAKYKFIYISVPKKNHIFQINGVSIKLSDWIANVFIPAEKAEKAKKTEQKSQLSAVSDKKIEKNAFTMRFTGFYESQNTTVTLLAFRLNDSNTVSVIYTPNKTIMKKTLRRHWFQRTYIEQFFKLLKHVMCIQQSITPNKHLFEVKLLRFAFVALHLQKLIRAARKKYPALMQKGIGYFKTFLQSDEAILAILQHQL
jgi:hypothetical protein